MLTIVIDNEMIPLRNIWYHYKEKLRGPSTDFEIKIDLESYEMQQFLIDFVGIDYNRNNLELLIINKERMLGSLGIIWHLIRYFDTNAAISIEDKNKPYYMLSNIKSVKIEKNDLIIRGNVDLSEN